jgi:shikimate kinase
LLRISGIIATMKSESIILIGMAGVGKSTIGRLLAQKLDFGFTDLDEYIRDRDGKTVQQVIDDGGDEALLFLEKNRLRELDIRRRVVAPGGSVIYHSDLMQEMRQRATIVYLDDSIDNIEKRITNLFTRGIVGLKSKSLRQIYDERRPLYLRYADITVDCQRKTAEQITAEIIIRYRDLTKAEIAPG